MIKEVWIPITGMSGSMEVSNKGRIRSYKKLGRGGNRVHADYHYIKACKDGRGYLNFTVTDSSKKKKVFLIHREVAKHFISNPNGYKIVRHLNDIKTDNAVDNLAWGDHKLNRIDGIRNGKQFHEKGERCVQRKLNDKKVKKIFETPVNNCELGRIYGVTESTISKIKLGRTWNHVTGVAKIK